MTDSSKSGLLATAVAIGLAVFSLAVPSPAHAWWRGGFFVGVAPGPFVFAPPVAYPPVYAPPPDYGPPPDYYEQPPPAYRQPPRMQGSPPLGSQEPPGANPPLPEYGYEHQPPTYGPGAYGPGTYGPQGNAPGYAPQADAPGYRPQANVPGERCYAGAYMCPLERPLPAGRNCWCPTGGAGRVWGQAG